MRVAALGSVLGLAATLFAAPVFAADDWPADKVTCAGAYGALAQESAALILWRPQIADGANFTTINWADRRQKLLAGGGVTEVSAKSYEDNFRQMLRIDRIDNVAKHSGVIIGLSMRCDTAFAFSPSFVVPQKN